MDTALRDAFLDEIQKISSVSILDGTSEEVKSFLISAPIPVVSNLLRIEQSRERPRKLLIEWMERRLGAQKTADFKISPPTKQREEYPYQGTASVAGLKIDIENKKGTTRRGEDPDGHEWSIKMRYHYGEIRGTEGKDGDPVDVCLGPNEKSKKVFIIHQQDPKTKKFDEDKVMVGFDSADEAKKMYLAHYDKPGFFQSMDETDFPGLKKLLSSKQGEKLSHIYLTGLPGSGKTTEGQRLSKETGLPLISLDGIPPLKGQQFPDTKAARRFIKKELGSDPHIVEGVQLLPFSKKELTGHDVRLLDPSREELVDRLILRGWDDEHGVHHQGEDQRAAAHTMLDELTPALDRFRGRQKLAFFVV